MKRTKILYLSIIGVGVAVLALAKAFGGEKEKIYDTHFAILTLEMEMQNASASDQEFVKSIKAVPGVSAVSLNRNEKIAAICYNTVTTSEQAILSSIKPESGIVARSKQIKSTGGGCPIKKTTSWLKFW